MGLLTERKTWKDVNRDEARALIPWAFASDFTITGSLQAGAAEVDVETYMKSSQPQVALRNGQKLNSSNPYNILCFLRSASKLHPKAWEPLLTHKKLSRRDSQREMKCSDSSCLFCCCCFLIITGGLYHMTRNLLIQNILLTSASCAVKQENCQQKQ